MSFCFFMNRFLKNKFIVMAFSAIVFSACNNSDTKKEIENTPASGTLKLLADDTFKPLLGTSIETFESINPNAKIIIQYKPQEKAFAELIEGNADVIIAGRPPSEIEEEQIEKKGLQAKVNLIASDALAFIVSKNYPHKEITEDKIAGILSGDLNLQLVCDKNSSGNLAYLKNRFNLSGEIKNIVAAGSDSAVVEYISSHPTAIGIIGMAFISDYDDVKVKERLSKVNLLTIQYKDSTGKLREGYPVQEDLVTRKYPFIRDIFIINLDGKMNLGSGFANFLVSERGQRIVLKSGLMPFRMPTREILINNK
jgi:phosphate transport system substrate-binding protein